MDRDIIIFDAPGGCYEDGMIALEGIRVFPMPWQARAVGLVVNGAIVMLTREEALDTADKLRSVAHDG